MRTLIETGLAQLGLAPQSPPSAPAQLERFGGLLLEKNRVMNLTAITDRQNTSIPTYKIMSILLTSHSIKPQLL